MIALLIVGLIFVQANERPGQASPLKTEAGSITASANPTNTTSPMAVTPLPLPQEPPRMAGPRITMDAELIGTIVVDGGRSYAVFELKTGQKLVRMGEEIISGVRLLEVRRNQIEIARGGVSQEIGLGSGEGTLALGSTRAAGVDMNRFDEIRKKKVESLNRFRARYVSLKRG